MDEIADIPRNLAVANPPSRFAICSVEDDGGDGFLLGWGIATTDRVHVYSVEDNMTGQLGSLNAIGYLFGEAHEIVWIDPRPEGLDGPG
ncbi:hypothetical protein AOZ06_47240 [Kibdelosporangium phytohabitans]|uniref:Uncharacterized protein n=1 Tax=Kibdelosporangium phytohabitans TaxID=860235 RepID=A0A0N9IAR0_9PSEU|nr:hypothetical protein AOZ06_47240 [Kibdelosporangium phytohabitans]